MGAESGRARPQSMNHWKNVGLIRRGLGRVWETSASPLVFSFRVIRRACVNLNIIVFDMIALIRDAFFKVDLNHHVYNVVGV